MAGLPTYLVVRGRVRVFSSQLITNRKGDEPACLVFITTGETSVFLSKGHRGKDGDSVFLSWPQFIPLFFIAPEERNQLFNLICPSSYIYIWQSGLTAPRCLRRQQQYGLSRGTDASERWRGLNRATSVFGYQLFHKEKKECLRNPCFTLLSQRVTVFLDIAHAASVEVGRLAGGWWGVGWGAGRFLRPMPGPDVVALAPSPDDLLLSWWFVPTTATSSVWAGITFCNQMSWMEST